MSRNAKDFEDVLSSFEKCLPLKVGAIISLYKDLKKNSKVADFIISLRDETVSARARAILMRKLSRVYMKFKSYRHCYNHHWDDMVNFANETFDLPPAFYISDSPTCVDSSSDVTPSIQQTVFPLSKILTRQQCDQCKVLQSSIDNYRTKNKQLRKICKLGYPHTRYDVRLAARRKQETITNLRRKNELLSKKIIQLRRQHKVVPKKPSKHKKKPLTSLQYNINKLQTQNIDILKENNSLKLELDRLRQLATSKVINTKEGKCYSYNVRKVIYCMLSHNVPVQHQSSLLQNIVKNLCKSELSSIPDTTTCSQMAYEMSILADLQTAEVLMNSKEFTFRLDKTSIVGSHLSDIIIRTAGQCYLLNITNLQDDTASDFSDHICSSLQQIAFIYSKYNNKDLTQVTSSIICAINSFNLSLNERVVKLLKERIDFDVLELKCNLHPLDEIANNCTESLMKIDTERGVKSKAFGNSCSLANILYGISKMR